MYVDWSLFPLRLDWILPLVVGRGRTEEGQAENQHVSRRRCVFGVFGGGGGVGGGGLRVVDGSSV